MANIETDYETKQSCLYLSLPYSKLTHSSANTMITALTDHIRLQRDNWFSLNIKADRPKNISIMHSRHQITPFVRLMASDQPVQLNWLEDDVCCIKNKMVSSQA